MAYATEAELKALFGTVSVEKWADKDEDQDATKISTAISDALDLATAQIDDRLRGGPYEIPFASAPTLVMDVCRKLAGIALYSSRGAIDFDANGEPIDRLSGFRQEAEDVLTKILNGHYRLNLDDEAKRYPEVHTLELNRESDLS